MANPKTTIVGVTRDALSLTYKTGRLLLRGTGKVLAYGHNAVDTIQGGYQDQRTKVKEPKQLELPLNHPQSN